MILNEYFLWDKIGERSGGAPPAPPTPPQPPPHPPTPTPHPTPPPPHPPPPPNPNPQPTPPTTHHPPHPTHPPFTQLYDAIYVLIRTLRNSTGVYTVLLRMLNFRAMRSH